MAGKGGGDMLQSIATFSQIECVLLLMVLNLEQSTKKVSGNQCSSERRGRMPPPACWCRVPPSPLGFDSTENIRTMVSQGFQPRALAASAARGSPRKTNKEKKREREQFWKKKRTLCGKQSWIMINLLFPRGWLFLSLDFSTDTHPSWINFFFQDHRSDLDFTYNEDGPF